MTPSHTIQRHIKDFLDTCYDLRLYVALGVIFAWWIFLNSLPLPVKALEFNTSTLRNENNDPFTLEIPFTEPTTVVPERVPEKKQLLALACENDAKCICINDAIYRHDSGWASAGVGKKTNNPGNLRPPRTWKFSVPYEVYHSPGNGKFAKFRSLKDGIKANVELYNRFYKDLPADKLVRIWADTNDRNYHNAVSQCYTI